MRFFRRLIFAISVLRGIQWVGSGAAGSLAGGVVGVLLTLTPLGWAFVAISALGAFALVTVTIAAQIGWNSPRVILGPPDLSDITITETHLPFPGGLQAAHAASATDSVVIAGRPVSKPAVMVLIPVSNEYAPTRNDAEDLTLHLSCWSEDGSRRLIRDVRAHERGAHPKAAPLTLKATGAPRLFDSVCKVIGSKDAGLYTGEGFTPDLRVTDQSFILRVVANGNFRKVVARYRIKHGGSGTRPEAELLDPTQQEEVPALDEGPETTERASRGRREG